MGKAIILVSPNILSKMFLLPEGYKVESVHASSLGFQHDGLVVVVESKYLAEVQEGQEYKRLNPLYGTDEHGRLKLLELKYV